MQLYVDRFNRRDWDGVRELTSADARLNVAERFAGKFADAPYFFNYERWRWPWKLALGELDGEPVVIVLRRGADTWTPHSAIRFDLVSHLLPADAGLVRSIGQGSSVCAAGALADPGGIAKSSAKEAANVLLQAGPALAPPLLSAFGRQRARYVSAREVQAYSGIAPVIERSEKKKWTHFRWAAPKFLRQSLHEWAGRSITQSQWARAYYEQQRQRGKGLHAAVRALAFKWIRIAFRCWKDSIAYDESRYLATLVRRASPLSASMVTSTLAKTL